MLVFISLFNLAVWIVLTFQSQSYYSTAIGAEAFGKMQWVVLQRFLLPLAIFFRHGCQMAIARFYRSYVFGPSGFWTMAPLHYSAKFDPFLSLDCAFKPSTLAQSKERKGSNYAICQPC